MTPPVQLPAGWQVHPQNPAYAYNAAHQVVEIAALLAQFAPAMQMTPALPVAAPQTEEAAWGEQDMEEAAKDYERAAAGGYGRTTNMVWLNFPKLQNVGQEVALYVRVLPPWKDSKHAYADVLQHRVYSRFLPRPSKKEAVMVDCPASAIWNQRCSICEVVKLMRSSPDTGVQNAARDLSRRGGALWQCVDLSNPARHYLQSFDAAGQPQTVIVPGVVRAGAKLHQEILRVFRHGNFCHPAMGFPLALIKKKTGPEDMNCEYSVDDYRQNAGPIDPAMQSVLYNLLNLVQDCCRRRPDTEMDEIAARIAANYLAPAHQQAPVSFPMPGM
ncbi:MAG TPA: hypothetical protein VIK52_10885, partial [Opitutaceae bacterium]